MINQENQGPLDLSISLPDLPLGDDDISGLERRLTEVMLDELGRMNLGGRIVAHPLPLARDIDGGGRTAGLRIEIE